MGGGGGGGADPNVKKHKVFVQDELNRQLLLAQLSGRRNAATLLSGGGKPTSHSTGTTLLRTG